MGSLIYLCDKFNDPVHGLLRFRDEFTYRLDYRGLDLERLTHAWSFRRKAFALVPVRM